jgi:hypothetical protein
MDDTSTTAIDTSTLATQPAAPSIETVIERWWDDHFPGSPVAQVTAAWNHALAAKEELKRLLKEFTSEAARR